MHDCKGRLIEKGDVIKGSMYHQADSKSLPAVGVVQRCYPGSDACNILAGVLHCSEDQFGYVGGQVLSTSWTAKNCEILMKADGSAPAEPAPAPEQAKAEAPQAV